MARVTAETVTLSVSGHTVSHCQTGPLLAQDAYNSIIQFMERQQYIGLAYIGCGAAGTQ